MEPRIKKKLHENFPASSKPLFVSDFAPVVKKYAFTNRLTAINQTICSSVLTALTFKKNSFKL